MRATRSRNIIRSFTNYRTDWRGKSPKTSTRDTVQRQRQQLQQWQGTHFSPEQGPQSLRFDFLRPCSHGCTTDIMGSVAKSTIPAQFSQERPRLSGPAGRRTLALAEFKLIYWGPHGKATK